MENFDVYDVLELIDEVLQHYAENIVDFEVHTIISALGAIAKCFVDIHAIKDYCIEQTNYYTIKVMLYDDEGNIRLWKVTIDDCINS